jgi:alpha-tubulin suppressor-like RCC1 family protein
MASGEIVVWGDNSFKQLTKRPTNTDFVRIVPGGATQSLAIRADDTLMLWGEGEVGLPPLIGVTGAGVWKVTDASMGPTHIVMILQDGTLVPSGAYPPLVKGGIPVPIPTLPGGKGFQKVAVGGAFGVAIDRNGKLQTWGSIPNPPKGDFLAVRARNDYAIGLQKDRIYGWGTFFEDPALVNAYLSDWQRDPNGFLYFPGTFSDIAAGVLQKDLPVWTPHVLAVDENNVVHGWGANTFGETIPTPGVKFTKVAAGNGFSVGLATDATLHHWGRSVVFRDRAFENEVRRPSHFTLDECPKGRFTSIGAGTHHATAVRGEW